jgi:threonine dehydratase
MKRIEKRSEAIGVAVGGGSWLAGVRSKFQKARKTVRLVEVHRLFGDFVKSFVVS